MENASKALIIAGAILLSILIIALGMRIYNSSTSSAANADLSATEIASFNSTFEAYSGAQKGTAVKQLITAAKSSNAKNPDELYIFINGSYAGGTDTLGDEKYIGFGMPSYDSIEDNKTYEVTLIYGSKTGLIKNIKVD